MINVKHLQFIREVIENLEHTIGDERGLTEEERKSISEALNIIHDELKALRKSGEDEIFESPFYEGSGCEKCPNPIKKDFLFRCRTCKYLLCAKCVDMPKNKLYLDLCAECYHTDIEKCGMPCKKCRTLIFNLNFIFECECCGEGFCTACAGMTSGGNYSKFCNACAIKRGQGCA